MLLRVVTSSCLALAVFAGAGFSQSYEDSLVKQLRAQGYSNINVSRTLLGRAQISATTEGEVREIILNPRTGEILRDLSQDDRGENPEPKLIETDPVPVPVPTEAPVADPVEAVAEPEPAPVEPTEVLTDPATDALGEAPSDAIPDAVDTPEYDTSAPGAPDPGPDEADAPDGTDPAEAGTEADDSTESGGEASK